MKPKEIQELIDYISNSGLAEVKIKTDEFELSIKKDSSNVRVVEAAPAPAPVAAAPTPAPAAAPAPSAPAPAPTENSNLVEIKSPMIGTFYLTPNPDSPAFVNVGDTVKPGQTVCIIEAMKLFNEIESEVSGKIVKILVTNSTPVEYDQPLFLVDPAG
ncbi:acetyl-CoA carboxylase biotin carboxyl carrier protein [Algoriphagus lutimaris]|uniref:acetyl-CoA carboxylase biotin carboxyl carrier protein n=1 Tax=Algoriphagus lutimaris TaxID=613197 RepID=UPI00196B395C|nr:acetyl-CoA carboxylase biotin carboxyl carrier protein [Algoriphagus lutimaris]MBN3519527.1 acetyl-CoA carboxylase biotin carboxyl carrier protein [Algoriphagus lutimaris]